MNQGKYLLMLGSGMECPGGISSVVNCYRQAGMFERWQVRYVSTFELPGMRTQLIVMSKALCLILGLLLRRKVFLAHAHSASRGSFWRKSVCCALARMFGVPYILHIHSGEFPVFYGQECGPIAKWWVRLTLERAARVIALTEGWRTALLTIAPRAKLEVIGNPIEVPQGLPRYREDGTRILFLGRLREKKGVFDLVRAIPAVLKHVPDAKFVLAGDGDAHAVRSLARKLGVENAIELPGWIDGDQKDAALREADILTLPSHFEGLPVCILEAMAAGAAVVATRVGGIPDVIESGVSGLITTPGDVEGLGNALIELLTDTRMRMRMRDAAFERAKEKFSVGNILRQMDRCFSSIAMPLGGPCVIKGGASDSA